MDYYKARKRHLHLFLIDLKKVYDKVPREVLWCKMTKRIFPGNTLLQCKIYISRITNIKTCGGETKNFSISIGLN